MTAIGRIREKGRGALLARATIALTLSTAMLAGACAVDGAKAESAAAAPDSAERLLTPFRSLSGARLATALDPNGTPSLAGGLEGFERFVYPAAVAGRGSDIYIADVGRDAVYRYDRTLDVMAALPGIRARTGVQLYVGRDLSLYVLDQPGRRVLHYARSGQLLATFSDDVNLGRPVDVAVDEARGRVLVADGMYNQLVAFHPLGQASYVISLRDAGEGARAIAAMAIGAQGIFLSDPLCRCVVQVSPDGALLGTFGELELNQPGPIAVDLYGRVFVVDRFDSSLKVYLGGQLIEDLPATELGLRRIDDIWIDGAWIILSDGSGAGVKLMRLAPVPAH